MKFFDRWRRPQVRADVGAGFWAAEARSMQRILRSTMRSEERRLAVVPARLRFTAGVQGRVVVLWRNTIVGFVPGELVAVLCRQLSEIGDAQLVADGELREHSGLWRVWVGSWPGTTVPEPPVDEIVPEPTRILGIPLTRGAGGAFSTGPAQSAPAPQPAEVPPSGDAASPGHRWVLAVGSDSWEVRDGADLDVALLRRRIADGVPGSTVYLRLWEQTIPIRLAGQTRVSLTETATGAVEVLYPDPGAS